MFIVKRNQNQVGKKSIKKIVYSLYMSKLRYGLPLFGKIKWKENNTQEKWLTDLQFKSKQNAKVYEWNQTNRQD